jgi:uncharacterized protein with GYD domain
MIRDPGDRTATVRRLAESLGGSVECVYWMLGGYDGIVILDVPDSISGAALSITVGSTGSFKNLQTHELLTQEQLGQALSRSKDAAQAYYPPGQQEAIDQIYGERLTEPPTATPSGGVLPPSLFEHPAAEVSVDDSAQRQLCEDRRQPGHIA